MMDEVDQSLKMLSAALEKEEFGRDAYRKAVDECANELGKDIFRMLLAEEGIHIARIKHIYADLSGGKSWSDKWKSQKGENEDLKALFRERAAKLGSKVRPATSDLEALEIGMEFEQGAIKFFQDQLAKAENPLEKEFIERMIAEERGHYVALADMKLYFTDPESWSIEMERHSIDGA